MRKGKRMAARITGNFLTTFASIFLTFNFITELPTIRLLEGALLSGVVIVIISIGYELQKYGTKTTN